MLVRQQYPVVLCSYSFAQATGARGRVRERVRPGLLELVLDVPAGDQLLQWAATPHYPLDGHVSFYQASDFMARETVSFKAGECVRYQELFEAGAVLVGSYRCTLTIAAAQLVLTAGGLAGSAAGAAAGVGNTVNKPAAVATMAATAVAVVSKASAAVPTSMASPTGPWVDALESQLPISSGIRTALAGWVASGLSENKLKSAFRGAVDPQLVFDCLRKAEITKGIYQQQVVIDDYQAILGVTPTTYVSNGLPAATISASDFGVNDPALDLPARNAQTFTGSAQLVEMKPGEKMYRVTSDPDNDKYARMGGYWTRTPPTALADVVGGTAVMPEWNNFQRVYEFTVPPVDPANSASKLYAWEGPAAAQAVSGEYPNKIVNGHCLLGGDNQLFIPTKFSRAPGFGNHITDVTHLHKSW